MNRKLRPKKSLGQNFLISPGIVNQIVEALNPVDGDTIVEIGPGRGSLTSRLVKDGIDLVGIELDDHLYDFLTNEYDQFANVRFIHLDVLRVDFSSIARERDAKRLRVVGNIPYNITSPLIFHLLSFGSLISEMLLMVQKEVGERLASPPGNKVYGALTVSVNYRSKVEYVRTVSRGNFAPMPKVDSALIRISVPEQPPLKARDEDLFRELVRAVFSQRRKQIQKVLRKHPYFELDNTEVADVERVSGLDLSKRGEELSVDQFVGLSDVLAEKT